MKMKGLVLAAGAVLGLSSAAMAQFTALNAGPLDSNGPAGDALNGMFTFNYAGPAFQIGTIDFSGDLTEINTATWASEARWRITNPAGVFADFQMSTTNGFTGTLNVTTMLSTSSPFSDPGSSVGTWTFQAFESFDDGGDLLVDSTWANLSFTFNAGMPPPPPPPAFSGSFAGTPNVVSYGVPVAGTTIWDPANPQPGLTDGAGEGANAYGPAVGFTEAGNEVGYRFEHSGGDLAGNLTGLSTDIDLIILDSTGLPVNALTASANGGSADENVLVAGAAPGTYYFVIDTFGTTNAGSDYVLTVVPAPGAFALLGLGGLVASRRRR